MATIKSFMDQLTRVSAGKAGVIENNKKQTFDQPTDPQPGFLPYPRKFEMVSDFAFGMKELLTISDRYNYGVSYLWYHSIRHIMKYAFNEYPVPGIRYENILISRGNLWNTQEATAMATHDAITFTWTNDAVGGGSSPDDKCILAAYCKTLNKWVFTKEVGERYSGEAKLLVPGFHSQKVQTWLGFISVDGKRIANSIYTGEVIIT